MCFLRKTTPTCKTLVQSNCSPKNNNMCLCDPTAFHKDLKKDAVRTQVGLVSPQPLSKQEAKIQNLEKLAAIGREMMAVKDTIVAECAALQNEIVECEAQKDALSLENAKLLGRLAALEQD